MKIEVTKNEMMEIIAKGGANETFNDPYLGHFDVSLIRSIAKAKGYPVISLDIKSLTHVIQRDHLTEQSRIVALSDESWKTDPGIFIVGEVDGQPVHRLIDGVHRALRRQQEGLQDMPCWLVPVSPEIMWKGHVEPSTNIDNEPTVPKSLKP